jgi:hypothetical protein
MARKGALTSLTEVGQIYSLHPENCYRTCSDQESDSISAATIMASERTDGAGGNKRMSKQIRTNRRKCSERRKLEEFALCSTLWKVDNADDGNCSQKRHFLFGASLGPPPMQSEASFREQSDVEVAYKACLHAWKDKDYAALDRLFARLERSSPRIKPHMSSYIRQKDNPLQLKDWRYALSADR